MAYKDAQTRRDAQNRYRAENKDVVRAKEREYRKANKERLSESARQCRLRNRDKYLEADRISSVQRRRRIRDAVIQHLGGRCVKCGFADTRALQIDHVNGGGTKDHTEKKSVSSYYQRVMASAPNKDFQLLCANCNQIKRYEMQEGVGANWRQKKCGASQAL